MSPCVSHILCSMILSIHGHSRMVVEYGTRVRFHRLLYGLASIQIHQIMRKKKERMDGESVTQVNGTLSAVHYNVCNE